MKLTSITLLLPLLLAPIVSLTIPTPVIAQQIQKTANYGPWRFSVQNLGSNGRMIQNPYDSEAQLEAAGHWVVVNVRVTNTSKSRQSAKDLILAMGSQIVGAKGKSYDIDHMATGDMYKNLEVRPFNPGESRDFSMVFDTPTKETFRHVEIAAMKSTANIRLAFK